MILKTFLNINFEKLIFLKKYIEYLRVLTLSQCPMDVLFFKRSITKIKH